MIKFNSLHSVIVNHYEIQYFYQKEKRDINGNPRFRVFIIDPEAPTVCETIFKCYESQISEYVKMFTEAAINA